MAGVACQAGDAYISRAPDFTSENELHVCRLKNIYFAIRDLIYDFAYF